MASMHCEPHGSLVNAVPEAFATVSEFYGEVHKFILSGFKGYTSLGCGKCGILIAAWGSKGQHDRDTEPL